MTRVDGVVSAIASDKIYIRLHGKTNGCGNCGIDSTCRGGFETTAGTDTGFVLPGSAHARVGDCVTLNVGEGVVWKSAAFVYLLPVMLVILGAATGDTYGSSLLHQIMGALSGLMVGVMVLYLGNRHLKQRRMSLFDIQIKQKETQEERAWQA